MSAVQKVYASPAQPRIMDYQGIRIGIAENAEGGYAIAFTGCMPHSGEHGYILISAAHPRHPESQPPTWHIVAKEGYVQTPTGLRPLTEPERAARYAELSRKQGQPLAAAIDRVKEDIADDCRRAELPRPDMRELRARAANHAAKTALTHIARG